MSWLPMYATERDLLALLSYLNESDEIAFIVSDGTGKWIAGRTVESLKDGRHCLWHVPSGALPLVRGAKAVPGEIDDPFAGWSEAQAGADPTQPYFGAGHPGVFWLNIRSRVRPVSGEEQVGLSTFEWIGNRYKVVGSAAHADTERCWKALFRWVKQNATKVPRGGPQESTPPEIWAFEDAQAKFESGMRGASS